MESDYRKMSLHIPTSWMAIALLSAFVSGCAFTSGHVLTGIAAVFAAIFCGMTAGKRFRRVSGHLDYMIQASLNGDFSYRFPVSGLSRSEREVNETLNRIVGHIEALSADARHNEEFLAVVINLVDTGIIVADDNGNVRQHNAAATRMLDMHALTNLRRLTPDKLINLKVSETRASLHGENMTIITLADLSKPLQKAEVESWEKLTRVLTHEIMNSLTPISSIAEALCTECTDRQVSEAFGVIKSSSESLMSFVKNFRKFTVLPVPVKISLPMNELLQSVASLMSGTAHDRGAEITTRTTPTDMLAYTDPNLLRQVLVNMVKNAVEASPEHIRIEARVEPDESVSITVTNDGETIPEEIVTQIFVPFFTTRKGGAGIGLSLSRRIIAHLGGSLTLATHPMTCFTINLP